MEPTIYCVFEQSAIKNNFLVCKYCQSVVTKSNNDSEIPFNICPVLLEQASQNPEYSQINLKKITTEKHDGTSVSEIIPEKKKSHQYILSDWWFGPASPDLKPTQPLINHEQMMQRDLTNKKQCTQEQIDARMDICKGCEFFKDNTCMKCGCALSREKNYMNKLLWADQSCPIKKW
jgi:hypothetical protein